MKVLYISGPSFLDMDLSFVRALNKHVDCVFLMDLYPKLHKATALNLEGAPVSADIFPMSGFPAMQGFSDMLDLEKCFVINRTSDNPLAASNLLLQLKLLLFVAKLKPDIIHFNNIVYFSHFYLYFWARRILISIHDPFPHSGEEADANRLSARFYRFLSNAFVRFHLLYNDRMISSYADDRGIDKNRVLVSSLGPYEYLGLTESRHESPATDFLIFGRIQKYKGIDLLLDAFLIVLKDFPDSTLTIAGSGKFWFDLAAYGIPERNLRVLNRFIPGDELAGLLESCKVVVCPYRDATQSGVVMSAYAFHRPVIVTDVGALSQVVEDGCSGLIVEPGNVVALADAMKRTLSDDSPLKEAAAYIDEVYHRGSKSWSAIAQRIVETYKKVMWRGR